MNDGNDILRVEVFLTRTLKRDWSRRGNLRDLKVKKA